MTCKDLKSIAPEKVHPSSCCTCRQWTLILGVVTTCLLGAIVVSLAIMNLEYFRTNLKRDNELRGELVSFEESRKMHDDCDRSKLPVMSDDDYKQTEFNVSGGDCRRTRVQFQVRSCGDGGILQAIHDVNIDNNFVYYLVNNGGKFREIVQEKQTDEPKSSSDERHTMTYVFNEKGEIETQ